MAINVFCLSLNFSRIIPIFADGKQKNNSLEIISPVKYGSRWNHSSHHPCLCVPRSIGLGTESIGMGIRVSPRGVLHQFRLPFLGLRGNCPLVRYDNDMRMRRKKKTL